MPPFAVTYACGKCGDIERQVGNGINLSFMVGEIYKSMRTYDVYRYEDLVARVRILDSGTIEWAYRQEHADWQGFWWSNDGKFLIEEVIQNFPNRQELAVSVFTLRRCGEKLSEHTA